MPSRFISRIGSPEVIFLYGNDPKLLDRHVLVNSVDPDLTAHKEQSDQDLQCLPFCLHCLDKLLCGKSILLNFKIIHV